MWQAYGERIQDAENDQGSERRGEVKESFSKEVTFELWNKGKKNEPVEETPANSFMTSIKTNNNMLA